MWKSQEWKELFRWNKAFFIVFEGLTFDEKIKKLIKIADTSFDNQNKLTKFMIITRQYGCEQLKKVQLQIIGQTEID